MKEIDFDSDEVVLGAEIAVAMGKTHMIAWVSHVKAAGYAAWIYTLPDLECVENKMRADWIKRRGIPKEKTINLFSVWRLGKDAIKASKQEAKAE